jgi:cytidyltransferase-like protein
MSDWYKKVHVQSSLERKEGQRAMFIGRWQPLHKGHQELFQQAMNEGKDILICIRDIQPDEKNPYTAKQVESMIITHYYTECVERKVKVMIIPDICSVEFGRGVGYDIIEHLPPLEIADISATKIREQLRTEGKL